VRLHGGRFAAFLGSLAGHWRSHELPESDISLNDNSFQPHFVKWQFVLMTFR
jgi:hypothetical protein